MRSMTFQIDDQSTGTAIPAVVVTITENADGTVSFTVTVVGDYTGDLRGFFFDLADEGLIGTLSVAQSSAGFTELQQADDAVLNLDGGSNMLGLSGSEGGYDAGIEIGTAGTSSDDYHSFSFTLSSSEGPLTLEDFANVDFGVRLTSVGEVDGSRTEGAKLLETTSSAVDARDDANEVHEDSPANPVTGNVFHNDLNLAAARSVTAVNGSTDAVGLEIEGIYGSLRLNADGTYSYTLDNANASVQALADGQTITESFSYTALSADETTSSSTDSANLAITIVGTNDGPVAVDDVVAGAGASTVLLDFTGDVDLANYGGFAFEGFAYLVAPGGGEGDDTFIVTASDSDVFGSHDAILRSVDGQNFELRNAGISTTEPGTRMEMHAYEDGVHLGGVSLPGLLPGEYALFGSVFPSADEVHFIVFPPEGMTSSVLVDNIRVSRDQDAWTEDEAGAIDVLGNDYDPDAGDAISVSSVTASAHGAAVTINTDGTVQYDPSASAQLQALDHNELIEDSFTYTVRDDLGLTDTATVRVTVQGVNDAPDITGGDTAGLVYEDGARLARGQLAANDPDGTTPDWSVVSGPMFGAASIDANGRWTYALDNARFEVQRLAQGEVLLDTFTVRAGDVVGASDTEQVTIQISGTNDRPFIAQIFPPPPPPVVTEDVATVAQGQGFAFDIDNGAVQSWSLSRNTALGYASDYHVAMDEFRIWRDGTWIFTDTFSDGLTPPSAPNFSGGQLASYGTSGLFIEDAAAGRLVMDGMLASAFPGTGYPEMDAGHAATLNTNIDPLNTTNGLKINHDFVVEAIFDLTIPDAGREGYGFQLSDGTGQLGDDRAGITVRKNALDGLVYVQAGNNDAVADTATPVARHLLALGGADQILLRLSHDDDDPGVITASYDYLTAGLITGGGVLGSSRIFGTDTPDYAGDDEIWTRAQILALGPERYEHVTTLEGAYGTLSIDQSGQWNYSLDNDSFAVQALGEGDFAFDSFHLRVTDQYGLSSSQPLAIQVNGLNDAPDAAPAFFSAFEDADLSGILSAFDVDGDSFSFELLAAPQHGTLSLASDGAFTYTPDLNYSGADGFTYRAVDEHGSDDVAAVSLEVIAIADTPALAVFEGGGDSGEFAITGNATTAISEHDPAVAALADGGYVVAWYESGATSLDVVAQRFDAAGQPLPAFRVSADDLSDLQNDQQPSVAQLANGNLVFAWLNSDGLTGMPQLVGRMFDADGTALTQEFELAIPSTGSFALYPQVAPFGEGFVATWSAAPAGQFAIFGQVFDANGQPTDGQFQISQPTPVETFQHAFYSPVATLADGGYVVLFREDDPLGSEIRGQRYDSANLPVGGSFAVSGESMLTDWPDVAATPDGGFVATWMSYDSSGQDLDIYARRFGADGSALSDVIAVSEDAPGFFFQNDYLPAVAATGDGSFAVVWDAEDHSTPGINDRIMLRRFNADGTAQGGILVLTDEEARAFLLDSNPDVAALSNGAFAAVWDGWNVSDPNDILGRIIGGGEFVTNPGVPVALNISATLTDTDGSEFLTLTISGVPAGGMLSAGTHDGNGTWTLTPGELAGLMFTPPAGSDEDVTLTVTATATEFSNGSQASTAHSFTVVVNPVNHAPDITGGDTTGLVYEDGARVARGQLAASDADGTIPSWAIGATPMFGFASVDAAGAWTYTLDNFRFEVQNLAQGQTRFDTFTVRASDGQASDGEQVTVQISGTNDRPFVQLTPPPPPPGFPFEPPLPPEVSEDGTLLATGQASAFDIDSDAGMPSWSLSRGTALGFASDYDVTMDSFRVWKNGTWIFEDHFSDGLEPPSAPNFSNGQAATYGASGIFDEDPLNGGRLIMDGALASAFPGTGYPDMDAGHSATLNTNIDPLNLVGGLKLNHDFRVEAVFDLTIPDQEREGYGFQLSDGSGQLGDDRAGISVRRIDGQVYVQFRNNDAVADAGTLIERDLLDPQGADQILLRLSHNAGTGLIEASYDYLTGGVVIGGGALGSTLLFGRDTPGYAGDDENWTRAQILAFGPESFEHTTTLQGEYGTLSIDPGGQWSYSLNNNAANVQALDADDAVFDTFHVRATDQYGLSSSQSLTVTVHGADDPIPDGLVYEDGARVARGQAGGTANWSIDTAAAFGFVSVDAAGVWTYTLDNSRFEVQQLAQNQQRLDTFTVRSSDANGVFGSEQVAVQISGTNDRPFIVQFFPPPPPPAVSEDTITIAGGQAFASDIDSDAGTASWSLSRGTALGYAADYHVTMDELRIWRDGTWIFTDTFSDGLEPPSAPNFSGGQTATYGTSGIFDEDPLDGGRLIMHGTQASAFPGIGHPDMDAGHAAALNTNTDSLNTTNGLKLNHDFIVEAVFDLSIPDAEREGYGIQLTDGTGQLGDDRATLTVRRTDGDAYVQFRNNDAVADAGTLVERDLLDPQGANQILLRLTHNAGTGVINASYDYLTGGVVTGGGMLGSTSIFGLDTPDYSGDDEKWTRAQILAFGPDTYEGATSLQGEYGTLSIGQGGEWVYSLNNDAPNVQALTSADTVFDNFHLRVTDQYGLSSSQPLTVTVTGTDDVQPDGLVYEDGARSASGLTPSDVPAPTLWSIDAPAAYGFAGVDAMGHWTYTLDNTRAQVQQLAQNQALLDTFTVRAVNEFGASGTAQVTVQISGSDDRPFISSAPGVGSVTEDGVQVAGGMATAFDIDNNAGPAAWSISRGTPFGYASDYHASMDAFRIFRNGSLIFNDTFSDGAPPPSAPAFSGGQAANYVNVGGVFGEDAFSGRLLMDGALATSFPGTSYPDMDAGHSAILSTNTDSANTVNGLKINHDFVVEAVFDLTVPDQGREGYGFQLSDSLAGPLQTNLLGDDRAGIAVRHEDGAVYVQLTNGDAVTDTRAVLARELLDPLAGEQILLRLSHDADNPGVITASYDYLVGGMAMTGGVLGTTSIFGRDTPDYAGDDESWTRAQILAFGPERYEEVTSLRGTYGTLSIDQGGAWSYELDNAAANVQALGVFQTAFDSFHLRATDQYGLSSSQQLAIAVEGASDGGVTLFGGPEADVLVGSPLDDLLVGGGGSDVLSGLGGPDRFDFNAIDEGVDTITDFTAGVGGDTLDIRDLLQPVGVPLDARVRLEASGGDTMVSVNPDGLGDDFVPIATLEGVTGLLLNDLLANGNLVA